MKCPVCGALCLVLETRYRKSDDYWYRRYECFSGHRFSSKEVVVELINDEKEKADGKVAKSP